MSEDHEFKVSFWLLTTAPAGRTTKRDSGIVHIETLNKIKIIIAGG